MRYYSQLTLSEAFINVLISRWVCLRRDLITWTTIRVCFFVLLLQLIDFIKPLFWHILILFNAAWLNLWSFRRFLLVDSDWLGIVWITRFKDSNFKFMTSQIVTCIISTTPLLIVWIFYLWLRIPLVHILISVIWWTLPLSFLIFNCGNIFH